jgi:hypothetical protein
MSKHSFISSRGMLTLVTLVLGFALPVAANAAADVRVSKAYGKLPLHFEVNQGQTHEDVRFLARGSGYSLYLTSGEAVFVLVKPDPDKKRGWHGKRDWRSQHERPKMQGVMLRMAIVGARPAPPVSGLEELPGRANYFIGDDPAKWRTNIPTYGKVHYRGVYPGIDLVYYGNQRQLEYDFIVAPGADPGSILLDFQGADRLEVNAEGELVLHAVGGALRQRKPVIYQEVSGTRREIAGGYVLQGANRVGFQVPAYDRSRPLVIDPVLSYSTYLGGGGNDFGEGIAVDANGNAYVTGSTFNFSSDTFPTTPGAFQTTTNLGIFHAFVTKLNPTGSALVYSTYLGGEFDDFGLGIAVDTDGNAYVTGRILGFGFPTTAGAFQTTKGGSSGGSYDAFVTKLNPTGSALVYSTYLGGGGNDLGEGIAVDADGNAYVTGSAGEFGFPTTAGAFQTTSELGGAFVAKFNPTGSALVYSTFLGVSGGGSGIAVDASGNAFVTGATNSTIPITAGAFQLIPGGGFDAFVTKLNPTGSTLVYSTYLGGSGDDFGGGIAVDADGNAYVTGATGSTNFPTTSGAFQPAFAGGTGRLFCCHAPIDAFVTKLNPTGSALVYSTYLGGSGDDSGNGIAVDTLGNAYLTGDTGSTNFPTTSGAFRSANTSTSSTTSDAFVAKFDFATTRFEQGAASYVGQWRTFGSEIGTFSAGTVVASNLAASTAMFSFSGTALSWIGVKCNACGIATVSIDGGLPTTVNTGGPAAPGSLTSQVVYSASGLAAGNHTIAITVTGATSSNNTYIAVDAFDVTEGSAAPPLLPPLALPLSPLLAR